MKKILSVLLAVMMLFGALGMTSSAAIANQSDAFAARDSVVGENATASNGQPYVIICYIINGGTYATPVQVYESGGFVDSDNPGAYYYRIPTSPNELYIGDKTFRPYNVVAPEGQDFDYWECVQNGEDYHPAKMYEITADMADANNVITLIAQYSTAAGTEDTMTMILGVLTKVFGAIVGFLFFNGQTEAGVELLEKMIGGIL